MDILILCERKEMNVSLREGLFQPCRVKRLSGLCCGGILVKICSEFKYVVLSLTTWLGLRS